MNNKFLKCIGIVCIITIINNHVTLELWEASALGFGIMLLWG